MSNGPRAIGLIMDGNRRWAKERGLSSLEGHTTGLDKVSEVITWARDAGIEEVTLYAFSTENWGRPEDEVNYLLGLFEYAFLEKLDPFIEEGGRVRFIGDRTRFQEKLQRIMLDTEERSRSGTNGMLIVALSYGGRAEILSAVNQLLEAGREQITEAELRDAMWSTGLLDPDLIIRTGGEKRLSNFLTWQSVYSELFFLDIKWPDFSKEDFDAVLREYATRERRRGK